MATTDSWIDENIPGQDGRVVVVTGGNSGIGAVTAGALAARGARVVLACRDVSRGEAAAAGMTGDVRVLPLDLADLASVRAFPERLGEPVHVLLNNAGVMAVPHSTTRDGFELHLGTNFLGPFALTGLLLPQITERVVTLSSVVHRRGRIDLDDLNWEHRRYARWGAYAQSKLADLMFARELQRRLAAAGSPVLSVAAHPGIAKTELTSHTGSLVQGAVLSLSSRMAGHSAEMGALPLLYAAASPDASPGGYYGPTGPGEVRGYPGLAASSTAAQDKKVAAALWARAQELTGVAYPSKR
ncbi:oxidoreductase [Kineosporia succinea]|uniref:NAD(P)-dependent dehydrogenase (Short-subunit alcohol dehydrogenase family) n=1 Tax=Kineosporia succinea TaxID=84632 RepID=A0ABT9P5M2_9ACTN|nr:oxidoreductase [Kineosporia succinea]MDP9827851.1 NAD(P)-dependent dehydrogenase (short-subunit alcohol dehydrogenase family) [Kineosporia succinea]